MVADGIPRCSCAGVNFGGLEVYCCLDLSGTQTRSYQ